ncbi:TRAP transporter substrate-binding protein [Ammoniphilus resinae]|uniref:Tripartite ATP-independent transporter DctP family solute receptor n=1 Tax=Ammoniphilus resinae TaxID=861532 RepID=A0ABS4GQX8_9BACL|nr:TRAP transporter substrate-binding protein [Ammoniphilus resinae]MBP1932641.1 tripartite ATP-independent transporter DctP family solute receptor [Ammoniphilus resinae]
MKKNKILSTVAAVSLAMGTILTGCGGSETTQDSANANNSGGDQPKAETIELNLGHTLAPDSHYHAMATKLAELVEQKSNGTIKVTVFPQSQLGGEVKMIQGARTGTVGMLITAQAPLTNTVPEYSLFDLPYLFDSIDQANEVLDGPVGDKFLDMLPEHGMVGLGWLSVMERSVFSNKPIKSAADMKGFKVRVMQSPGYVKAYEALGAQPTPMAYSEVYLSLQQGVVDGADTSPDQFVMDKFVEVSKYFNRTAVHYLPALVVVSKQKWDAMTPDQQKALQEATDEALAYGKDYYKKSFDESLAKAKEAGVEIVDTDLESMKKATQPVYEELLKEIPNGQALFDEVQAAKK